jgi:hypothetical protein
MRYRGSIQATASEVAKVPDTLWGLSLMLYGALLVLLLGFLLWGHLVEADSAVSTPELTFVMTDCAPVHAISL